MQFAQQWPRLLAPTFLCVWGGVWGMGCDGNLDPDGGVTDAGPPRIDVAVQFSAEVGDETFACSDENGPRTYSDIGTSNSDVRFKDMRFYVSNLRLRNGNGDLVPITLEESKWQYADVALLDFEDGTGDCVDVGNADLNFEVVGTVPDGVYPGGVVFDLAVPFENNHTDPSAANTPSPLNLMALAWSWQAGRKFARVDLNVVGSGGWNVHIGSTECVSDGVSSAPTTTCGKPNVSTINLNAFDATSETIVLDAKALLAGADLAVNNDGPPGCQSFPTDADDCGAVFATLGLSFDDGTCVAECANQTAFRVQE